MKKISIIICSRKPRINGLLIQNIESTIGCDYEIIGIDNSNNNYSIFKAYNIGIQKSTTDVLVFLHEDVLIHTSNWGNILQYTFLENPDAGLIGVAGSKVLTSMPSPWWSINENVCNIIQHFRDKPKERWNRGLENKKFSQVAAVDGVFMAMRSDQRIVFDERLEGFHNYDLSLSVQNIALNKTVLVTNEILIEHFSEGEINKSWYKSSGKFRRLYKNYLPIKISGSSISDIHLEQKEVELGFNYIKNVIHQKLYGELLYWWWRLFLLKPNSKFHKRIIKEILIVRRE